MKPVALPSRNILFSLGTIIFGLALGIGGTIAYFSDTEVSANNTFTSGTIDITIGADGTYNGQPVPLNSWTRTDLSDETLFYTLDDVKPGDSGSHAVTLQVDDNSAWACLTAEVTRNDDMTCLDPELADDPTCTEPGPFQGELGEELQFLWWSDDGNGTYEPGETILGQSTFATNTTLTLADSTGGVLSGDPLLPSTEYTLGTAWCHGTLSLTGGLACDGSQLTNAAQSDEVEVGLSFYSEQSRNNEDFSCASSLPDSTPVDPPPNESDEELVITLSSNNPDPAILQVEEDNESEEFVIFVFDLEAQGGDITLNELVVQVETAGATSTLVVDEAYLEIDGTTYDAENPPLCLAPGCEQAQYTFLIDGFESINENAKVQAELVVELAALEDEGYENGQTIQAAVTATETALWAAEGTDDIPPSNIEGSATGETHTLFATGLVTALSQIDTNEASPVSGVGEFEFELEMEAFGDDFFIEDTVSESLSTGIVFSVEGPSGFTATTVGTLASSADEDQPGIFIIEEGDVEDFLVTITVDPDTAGPYRVTLEDIFYTDLSVPGNPAVGSVTGLTGPIQSDFLVIN